MLARKGNPGMAWVIDSCVLLDLAMHDPQWGLASAQMLHTLAGDGLVSCHISLVEITPNFAGQIEEVRRFLSVAGIAFESPWLETDTIAAAAAWTRYVDARRKRGAATQKRSVADLLIGAFSERHSGLVTRNPDHFAPWFPQLALRVPGQG